MISWPAPRTLTLAIVGLAVVITTVFREIGPASAPWVFVALALFAIAVALTLIISDSRIWSAAALLSLVLAVAVFSNAGEPGIWPVLLFAGGTVLALETAHLQVRLHATQRRSGQGQSVRPGPLLTSLAAWSLASVALAGGIWLSLDRLVDLYAHESLKRSLERFDGAFVAAYFMLCLVLAWLAATPWWAASNPAPDSALEDSAADDLEASIPPDGVVAG